MDIGILILSIIIFIVWIFYIYNMVNVINVIPYDDVHYAYCVMGLSSMIIVLFACICVIIAKKQYKC